MTDETPTDNKDDKVRALALLGLRCRAIQLAAESRVVDSRSLVVRAQEIVNWLQTGTIPGSKSKSTETK